MRIYSVSRGGSEPETAVQRYNRLKCEAGELWEEVNGMKNEAAAGSDQKKSAAASDINSVGDYFMLAQTIKVTWDLGVNESL